VTVLVGAPALAALGPAQYAVLAAAVIAGMVALAGYLLTQWQAQRDRKLKVFADALAAVAEYEELPYRIRRRSASEGPIRAEIANRISDVQVRIAFHLAWLEIESPAVAEAYRALVDAARQEAGAHMKAAWNEPVLSEDAAMSLGIAYACPDTPAARERCIAAMRDHLELFRHGGRRPRTHPES
jgi:hypothetical protein